MEKRGRHEPANKTLEERLGIVQEHIEQFPRYQSHYSRQDNPHREYLSPSLSLATMYKLYKDECTEQGKPAVSEWKYRQIFNTKYNLAFGRYVYAITPFGVVLLIYPPDSPRARIDATDRGANGRGFLFGSRGLGF